MSQLLSKLLSYLGSLRIRTRTDKVTLDVGDPKAIDAKGSMEWKAYTKTEALYEVWGPAKESPWDPYHCVPLFASLPTLPEDRIGPGMAADAMRIDAHALFKPELMKKPLEVDWAQQRAWVILDLPGVFSVPMAVRLMATGFQPVCTFDNWPHWVGLIKPEIALGQLLRYASTVKELRESITKDAPPVWVCDRDRLGDRGAKPREFDNRYFLDDSILPSPETLLKNGIRQIICVVPTPEDKPRDDLRAYFRDLLKEKFEVIQGAALSDPELKLFSFPTDTFDIKFSQFHFRRNDAGGFGMLVPEPSSSGG